MGTSLDLDKSTAKAWEQLERDVVRRITELQHGEAILLQLDAPEREQFPCSPYVQVLWTDRGPEAEVSSNHYLHQRYRLDKEGRRALCAAGWRIPDKHTHNYSLPVRHEQEHAEAVAERMIKALRHVFGVVHPAFLVDFGTLERTPAEAMSAAASVDGDAAAGEHPSGAEAGEADTADHLADLDAALQDLTSLADELETYAAPAAVRPVDADHLRRMVEEVVAGVLGHKPEYDADGDIPVVCGRSLLYVRVLEGDAPVVRIFGELVAGVTEPDRASYEINVLNRDVSWAKFLVFGDTIAIRSDVLAQPFAAAHLRVVLEEATDVAARCAPDLAFRVGGRCFLDADEEAS